MADAYGDALTNLANKDQTPQVDPQKAKDFQKGFQQPQTIQEGWQNIKNELGIGQNTNKPKDGST